MTQAISLQRIIEKMGHHLVRVYVGKNQRRTIPDFFYESMRAPVTTYSAPNFVVDPDRRGILIGPTILQNLFALPRFLASMQRLQHTLTQDKPDIIVNFYEVLAGIAFSWRPPTGTIVCVGHQYLLSHPEFPFPSDQLMDRWLIQINTALTALGASRHIALSFREMPDLPDRQTFVAPPLLREAILDAETSEEPFLLTYILNDGYADDIVRWHEEHTHQVIHCFWDRPGVEDPWSPHPNLQFHQLSATRFLDLMRRCRGVVTTAGFETVCEAMYLGKPIMMVPTMGHFEQRCNAIDAVHSRAGIINHKFDFSPFLDFLDRHSPETSGYRSWVDRAPRRFAELLTGIQVREGGDAVVL